MSLAEILKELPNLTEEERETIREALDVQKEEENAIDEGFQSLSEEPQVSWAELNRRIREKHGWK
jgi:hypothetical protein